MTRAEQLGAFLKTQMGAAGEWNCSTLAADWCLSLGHPDFAAKWRDVTGYGACEVGDLAALWDEGIGSALGVIDDPEPGDIGVVSAHGLEAGAIWNGKWVIRMPRGLHFASPDIVTLRKGWRP